LLFYGHFSALGRLNGASYYDDSRDVAHMVQLQ